MNKEEKEAQLAKTTIWTESHEEALELKSKIKQLHCDIKVYIEDSLVCLNRDLTKEEYYTIEEM